MRKLKSTIYGIDEILDLVRFSVIFILFSLKAVSLSVPFVIQ